MKTIQNLFAALTIWGVSALAPIGAKHALSHRQALPVTQAIYLSPVKDLQPLTGDMPSNHRSTGNAADLPRIAMPEKIVGDPSEPVVIEVPAPLIRMPEKLAGSPDEPAPVVE